MNRQRIQLYVLGLMLVASFLPGCSTSPTAIPIPPTATAVPPTATHAFADSADEVAWLLQQFNPDDPGIDGTAILAYSRRDVSRWIRILADAGLGSVGLDRYEGTPMPGVKVGTFARAKGLEFARVFVPGLSDEFPMGNRAMEDNIVEKASSLYVAMSRARDGLMLSYAGAPSMFLEPVRPFCDAVRHG